MVSGKDYSSLALPDQKNYEISLRLAFKLAAEKLNTGVDLEELCRRSGSTCLNGGKTILVDYLNSRYRVDLPEAGLSPEAGQGSMEIRDRIMVLHYLTRATGVPLSGRMIAYQELAEGAAYYPTFLKRAVKPLADYFGAKPEKLPECSRDIGGIRADYGDVAVTIPAFRRVPVTLVLWRGDEEFPPSSNILFDSTVLDYLPAEDINVLCQTISWRLVKNLQSGAIKEESR
jgi:hypothetical protein